MRQLLMGTAASLLHAVFGDMIESARGLALAACAQDPELSNSPRLAALARRFLVEDQIEYLDKS